MSVKAIWFAFGVGVSAGAAVALLYAPQSGAVTREGLRKGLGEAGDSVSEAADYLKEQAQKLSMEAQKALEENKDKLGGLVADAVEASTGAVKGTQSMF